MRTVPLAVLLVGVFLSMSPARAAEPEAGATEDPLLQAVLACPLSLREATISAFHADRRLIAAEFVLGTDERLLLRATVRVSEGEASVYESWLGLVHAAGWVPSRRTLEEGAELDEARRQWARVARDPQLLSRALAGAVRTDERPGPADVALSIATTEECGEPLVALRIGVDGRLRGLTFDPDSETYRLTAPTPIPDRVSHEAAALPSLDVVDGTWFNVEEAPTLDAWRGSPVLVVITDPG